MDNSSSSIDFLTVTDFSTPEMMEVDSIWAMCATTVDDVSAALLQAGRRIKSRIVGGHISLRGRSQRSKAMSSWDAAWGTHPPPLLLLLQPDDGAEESPSSSNWSASTTLAAMIVTNAWPKMGATAGDLLLAEDNFFFFFSLLLVSLFVAASVASSQRRRTKCVKQQSDDSITSKFRFSFSCSDASFTVVSLSSPLLGGGGWQQLSPRHWIKLSRSMKLSDESPFSSLASLNPSSSSSSPAVVECPSRNILHS
mmetsp:Transcript_34977/g.62963  ORF Transcript_34977/g.62963 Transcript_34977/m.62963 type:complete len:253 (+) Transcript_34977:2940-3698(+)